MKVFVGLGNPGKEYEKTRHNVGVGALEYVMGDWREDSRFEDIGKEKNRFYTAFEFRFSPDGVHTQDIAVVFPQTYMNASGEAVKKYLERISKAFNNHDDLWVFHDDIDIAFGGLKIGRNASSAGHRGVQNIIDQLGTKDFVRFRIGIRPLHPRKKPTEEFVLQNFLKTELTTLTAVYECLSEACENALVSSIERAQSLFNKKNCS